MVAAPDLGSGAARRGGSSPFSRTALNPVNLAGFFVAIESLNSIVIIVKKSNKAVKDFDTVKTFREIKENIQRNSKGEF